MPLIEREVIPVFLSRQLNTKGAEYELEFCANKTLSNIVLQLSSLSKHAEDIFGELYNEADMLCKRSRVLQVRIHNLSNKVTTLDTTNEHFLSFPMNDAIPMKIGASFVEKIVSLLEFMELKPYSSAVELEPTPLTRKPTAVEEAYILCEPPPPLNELSQYREDGKEPLKFYTDPKYFFELWCNAMEQNIRDIKQKRREERQRLREAVTPQGPEEANFRTPKSRAQMNAHRLLDTETSAATGKRGMTDLGSTVNQHQTHHPRRVIDHQTPLPDDGRDSGPPPLGSYPNQSHPDGEVRPSRPAPRPPSQPTPTTLEPMMNDAGGGDGGGDTLAHAEDLEQSNASPDDPLPPPPPIDDYPPPVPEEDLEQLSSPSNDNLPLPPPPAIEYIPPRSPSPQLPSQQIVHESPHRPLPEVSAFTGAPTSELPPPPSSFDMGAKPTPSVVELQLKSAVQPDPQVNDQLPPPRPVSTAKPDARSDLLKAIEKGINLKKMATAKQKENLVQDNSIGAILSRKFRAAELSDSEDSVDSIEWTY